jgi:hypothetical protein
MADFIKILTPVFRVAFPKVFKPESFDGGDEKYSLIAIFDTKNFTKKDKKAWKALLDSMDKESKNAFKKPLKKLPSSYRKPLRDAGEKEDLDGFEEGMMFCTLSSKRRPGIINMDRDKIRPENNNEGDFYAGCYARASVTIYTYDNKGKGMSLGLLNIQKMSDGEALSGGASDAEDDFEEDDVDTEWKKRSKKYEDDCPFDE